MAIACFEMRVRSGVTTITNRCVASERERERERGREGKKSEGKTSLYVFI